ncbi:hypothetical protein [Xanthomonas sp. 4461]|uniref:hypothetical protein n=1 Tax=Xanthomonas sp. 4461 TaxID=3035313 RepID=UPI0021671381|nr:hypothetical protein [Xanthomonas sp. 4461]MCS3810998.1 hypothetical protein [Xanthomonas sp. 4461]
MLASIEIFGSVTGRFDGAHVLGGRADLVCWSAPSACANRHPVALVSLSAVGVMQSIGDFAEWRISDAWIWCLAASLLWLPVAVPER